MPPAAGRLVLVAAAAAGVGQGQLLSSGVSAVGALEPRHVQTFVEHLRSPIGLETRVPRFSWLLAARAPLPRLSVQSSYRLRVATSGQALMEHDNIGGALVWDSGVVRSDNSNLVEFAGKAPLVPGAVYWWHVGLTYNTTSVEVWSVPSRFSVGPDGEAIASEARFVAAPGCAGHCSECPWLRRSFGLAPDALSAPGATVLATVGSLGYHELWVNGIKASGDILAPPVSYLKKRLLLRTYDVTNLLNPVGQNVMGIWLSKGWAGFKEFGIDVFGTDALPAAALAQLSLTSAAQPTPQVLLATDGSWRASPSDTMHLGGWGNSNFGGDRLDLRRSQPLWAHPSLNDSDWAKVEVIDALADRLVTNDASEPNRLRERISAKAVTPLNATEFLVEMEQVFTGWVVLSGLRASKPSGTITIKASSVAVCGTAAAELASAQGRPYCSMAPEYNMQHELVVNGSSVGSFSPRFSYHEVHFLVLEGLAEPPALDAIVGHRIGNIADLQRCDSEGGAAGRGVLGSFTCSDPKLTRVYNVSMWTVANLVAGGISVDCPHRERLAYLGDAHSSLETAMQNFESAPFYSRWLLDIVDVQGVPAHTGDVDPEGYIPHSAPTIDGGGGPSWSGFVITMPWQVYLNYGDDRVLRTALPAMERLLGFWNRSRAADGTFHDWAVRDHWAYLGDWLTPHGSETGGQEAELFNNCYILYCIRIVANVHRALGDTTAADRWQAEAEAAAAAIHAKWWLPSSAAYLDSRQTHLAMPLVAGVVPPEHADAVWASLHEEIVERQAGHLDAGLHGTYFLTKLLYDTTHAGFGGRDELVHMLATAPTAPGYYDLMDKGFTTWPEAWGTCTDSKLNGQVYKCAEGEHWSSGSLSPAHGCLNGIGQWFVAGLGGIRRAPGEAGFRRFELRPAIGAGGLQSASASFRSTHGLIESAWRLGEGWAFLNVTVPVNSEAFVYLPFSNASSVLEGEGAAADSEGVRFVRSAVPQRQPDPHRVTQSIFSVGSGSYCFRWKTNSLAVWYV